MTLLPPPLFAFAPSRMSIISDGFRFGLAVLAMAVLVAVVLLFRHHRWLSAMAAVLALALAAGNVGATINAHYAYFPNVASLWGGYRGRDQTTWMAARERRAHALRDRPVRWTGSPTRSPVRSAQPAVAARPPDRLGSTPIAPDHGMLVRVSIPGVLSRFAARSAEVYLPPSWTNHPARRLPVVVLLHGTPGSPDDWARSAHVDEVSDRWADRHDGQAPILVMPDSNGAFWTDTECTDGLEGRIDTYLSVDVPAWIDTHLDPTPDHHRWGVGGLSEGGLCALDLTLRHPSTYSLFLDFGGEDHLSRKGGALSLFAGTTRQRRAQLLSYEPKRLLAHVERPAEFRGWFAVGTKDKTESQVQGLVLRARRRGLDVRFGPLPGYGHSFRAWARAFENAYPWMARSLSGDAPPRRPTARPRPATHEILDSDDPVNTASKPAAPPGQRRGPAHRRPTIAAPPASHPTDEHHVDRHHR